MLQGPAPRGPFSSFFGASPAPTGSQRPSAAFEGAPEGSALGEERHAGGHRVGGFEPSRTWMIYWITSSAVASSASGTARPSALAVLAFKAISNLIGS